MARTSSSGRGGNRARPNSNENRANRRGNTVVRQNPVISRDSRARQGRRASSATRDAMHQQSWGQWFYSGFTSVLSHAICNRRLQVRHGEHIECVTNHALQITVPKTVRNIIIGGFILNIVLKGSELYFKATELQEAAPLTTSAQIGNYTQQYWTPELYHVVHQTDGPVNLNTLNQLFDYFLSLPKDLILPLLKSVQFIETLIEACKAVNFYNAFQQLATCLYVTASAEAGVALWNTGSRVKELYEEFCKLDDIADNRSSSQGVKKDAKKHRRSALQIAFASIKPAIFYAMPSIAGQYAMAALISQVALPALSDALEAFPMSTSRLAELAQQNCLISGVDNSPIPEAVAKLGFCLPQQVWVQFKQALLSRVDISSLEQYYNGSKSLSDLAWSAGNSSAQTQTIALSVIGVIALGLYIGDHLNNARKVYAVEMPAYKTTTEELVKRLEVPSRRAGRRSSVASTDAVVVGVASDSTPTRPTHCDRANSSTPLRSDSNANPRAMTRSPRL